jgi:hypothetical protein
MEATKKIYHTKALELIKKGVFNSNYQVEFDNQFVNPNDAILLGNNGIIVPENLIQYDDASIDYSDISPVSEDNIKKGKINWIINAEIPLDNEISKWLKQQKIDVNELVAQLLKNFYQTVKSLRNNAAL